MLGWLYRALIGNFRSCKHEWEIYEKGKYSQEGNVIGYMFILKCKHCGEMKNKDFY